MFSRFSSVRVKDSVDSLLSAEAVASLCLLNANKQGHNQIILTPNESYARKLYDVYSSLLSLNESVQGTSGYEISGLPADLVRSGAVIPEIIHYAAWDTLPFENRNPDISVSSERSRARYRLLQLKEAERTADKLIVLICSVQAYVQKIASVNKYHSQIVALEKGGICKVQNFVEQLEWLGYRRVSQVEDLGQYAVRGSVVDIFTPSEIYPVRVQIFSELVDSVRFFECSTQKSLNRSKPIEAVSILPVREFGFPREGAEKEIFSRIVPALRKLADDSLLASAQLRAYEEQLRQGLLWQGAEMLSNELFHDQGVIQEYLSGQASVFFAGDVEYKSHFDAWSETINTQYEHLKSKGDLLPSKESLYYTETEIDEVLELVEPLRTLQVFDAFSDSLLSDSSQKKNSERNIEQQASATVLIQAAPLLMATSKSSALRSSPLLAQSSADTFKGIVSKINTFVHDAYKVILSFPTIEKLLRMRELFEERGLKGTHWESSLLELFFAEQKNGLYYTVNTITEGFLSPQARCLVLTEKELFSRIHQAPTRRTTFKRSAYRRHITSLAQIASEDYVVHEQYGIGKFLGLRALHLQGVYGEFLDIEYAGGAKLYVPIHDFLKVGKYSSSNIASPALTKLGSDAWEKVKSKVKQDIAALTGSLLKTIAVRSIAQGFSFGAMSEEDEWFAGLFPYEETPDQLRAIEDVLGDMARDKPMDRLVCGDVGFGKTEVALRAAFKAASQGKQVAILVPTTILADQHFRTFQERFEATPLVVKSLSRFVPRKEQQVILADLFEGKVDVVIGTHRLLQSDVLFHDLGLLIIDEEHRFGVAHKERFKQLRSEVDVLSLSATPIPRTLQMALFGTKDLSVIETPPVDRQAVHTEVLSFDENVCIEAIKRELAREGQVFVVNHYIEGLDEIASFIQTKLPEAKISIVHGRIPKTELESRMHDFYQGKTNILVATSIIESGLDISNANTMIIMKSEQFGLAQLYQLRGRVGRSSRKGYAYIFHSHQSQLTEDSRKRFYALSQMDEMGVGYRVALQDMEIRGAGTLLGKDQSGHVQLLGYEMYSKVLEDAVKAERLRRGQSVDEIKKEIFPDFEPDVKLGIDAFIPEDFIPDINERLLMYQTVAGLCFEEEVEEFFEDIEDRFGSVPDALRSLVFMMCVRNYCKLTGIQKFIRNKNIITFQLLPFSQQNDPRVGVLKEFSDIKTASNYKEQRKYFFERSNDFLEDKAFILQFLREMFEEIKIFS